MELTLQPNKLHQAEQFVSVDNNIITLIGENGCGKSAILESIFRQYLENTDVSLVCFSSGQNESFSDLYADYIKNSRKVKFEAKPDQLKIDFINSFYFDYDWSKILIFFASALKKNGLTRNLLSSKYLDVDEHNDDISTKLKVNLRIQSNYLQQIKASLAIESLTPDEATLRRTNFHTQLGKLIEKKINSGYDFTERLSKTDFEITANEVVDIFGRDVNKIFSFISAAVADNYFLTLQETELQLKNGLKLKDLSDGEYQLLSVYSIIDLFDNANTLFLFDEIDSHLYYKNLEKVWILLQNSINGKVITTTHISDSILNNCFSNIKLIQRGKIEHDLTLRELAKRLTNIVGKKKYELQLATRIENIVLVDNEDDWVIFKKLAEKKINENTQQVFSKIIPFKRTSSYNNDSEIFGKGKLQFAKDFKDQINGHAIQTKNIFMICDRDKLSKNSINNEMKVNIHNDYKDIQNFNGVRSHLLSWKRMEIENYLISVSMLTEKGKIQDLQNNFPRVNFNPNDNLDGSSDIEEYDAKELLHPLYKPNGFDETALDELISLIPEGEISEDINTMYNYLKNNIAN